MKKLKLIALVVFISALSTATTWAQEKGFNPTRWRIATGQGGGVLLAGEGLNILDPIFEAAGFIALGHFTDCECEGHDGHYHGVLFDEDDPDPDGCGWGCVDEQPATVAQALTLVRNQINGSTGTNTALASKLNGIINTAEAARSSDCNTLFDSALDALGDELLGALETGTLTIEQVTAIVQAVVDYAVVGIEEINPPFPPVPPPPKPCKVELMLRHGSGGQSKLFDAKRKVNADRGEVVVLDAQGCPEGGTYEWEYKFKAGAKGDVPSGAGISYTKQRFCVLSERATTVTVTVIYHCPDGKTVKDTATISIQ